MQPIMPFGYVGPQKTDIEKQIELTDNLGEALGIYLDRLLLAQRLVHDDEAENDGEGSDVGSALANLLNHGNRGMLKAIEDIENAPVPPFMRPQGLEPPDSYLENLVGQLERAKKRREQILDSIDNMPDGLREVVEGTLTFGIDETIHSLEGQISQILVLKGQGAQTGTTEATEAAATKEDL